MRRFAMLALPLLLVPSAVVGVYALSARPTQIDFREWSSPERRHELRGSEPDPGPTIADLDDLIHGDDFEFAMGVGSNMVGLAVFRIMGTGRASYVFPSDLYYLTLSHWWRADFTVDSDLRARLRELLVEVNYLSLDLRYDGGWMDGTQWYIRVTVNGSVKKVSCDNYFPPEVVRLAEFIGEELLPAHRAAIRRARPIHRGQESQAASLWLR